MRQRYLFFKKLYPNFIIIVDGCSFEECFISSVNYMVIEKFKVIDYQIYFNNQYEKNKRLILLKKHMKYMKEE